jgi:predicted amidophosphoribosyltransferase
MLTCPNCLHKLKDACVHCGKPVEQTWSICPYCENAVPGALPPRTRSRRRREPEYEETLGEAIAPEPSSS